MGCLSRMTRTQFWLAGSGVGLPKTLVASADLDAGIAKPAGWLEKQCGVQQRYVCGLETQDDLAFLAARNALEQADIEPSVVDLLIFASSVPKQPIPATAPLVARRLGLRSGHCTTFDVNATCLSFLTGLDIATSYVASGRYRCVVVVSAEMASRALPWATDPATAGLFGDGAAAVVVTPARPGSTHTVHSAHFETYHEGYEFCQIPSGGTGIDVHVDPARFAAGTYFQMDGPNLFRLSAKHFPGFISRLLEKAGWSASQVGLIVPHQASALALDHLVKRCGFMHDQVVNIVATYGNQIAASIPTALHIARKQQRLTPGTKMLLLGTSAGVMFGGMAIEL